MMQIKAAAEATQSEVTVRDLEGQNKLLKEESAALIIQKEDAVKECTSLALEVTRLNSALLVSAENSLSVQKCLICAVSSSQSQVSQYIG